MLQKNDVILFQGDSITDAGRVYEDPAGLGTGYPLVAASILKARFPHLDLTILNRGISGNRTADLLGRWKPDCIDLSPSILFVLIGINNVWRRYDSADPTDAQVFADEYHRLLTAAKDSGARDIIILEPFLLPVTGDQHQWREDLDPKIALCRSLAAEFASAYVPLDGLFAAAAATTGPAYWAPDGVHPSAAGHGLIAEHVVQSLSSRL